tara:strand:- start:1060 stop:1548 length:489 start_codon:yes stop_codon:yes gene_type:complete
MSKIWKSIESIDYKDCGDCIKDFKNKNYKLSPWIENIVKNKNFKFLNYDFPIQLIRKNVKDLGFEGPTELEKIYNKVKSVGLKLVPPEIAILCRMYYEEQETGEWLRFATPMDSMIDSDGVPHLPKLGKALGLYFIETYWSYPKAIFHPHNEFVFILPNDKK